MKTSPLGIILTIVIIFCILGNFIPTLPSLTQEPKPIERTGKAKELWEAANRLEGEEALKAVEGVLQLNPKDYEAWHVKAYLLGQLGRREQQLSAYDVLLKLQPKYAVAWR